LLHRGDHRLTLPRITFALAVTNSGDQRLEKNLPRLGLKLFSLAADGLFNDHTLWYFNKFFGAKYSVLRYCALRYDFQELNTF
jgi:hypothetical protein